MKHTYLILLLLLVSCWSSIAQGTSKREIKAAWKHIPKNIEECMNRLDTLFSLEAKKHFAERSEDEAVALYNLEQGTSLRNNWHLWHGSKLSGYFNSYKIYDPESMSSIVFRSYHRHLSGKPINFGDQIEEHHAILAKRQARPPKQTDGFQVGDSVRAVRYGRRKQLGGLVGRQMGYQILASITGIDTTTQKIKVTVLSICRTDTKERETVSQTTYNNQTISRGSTFWTTPLCWTKPNELTIIHLQ